MYKYNYNKKWVNNNFDIKSYKINDLAVVRHILENNTLSNAEAADQKSLKFKNYIIGGSADNLEAAERQIHLTNEQAKGTNKFPFKTIVETLNLQPQAPENQDVIKKWAEHEIQSWKNKGLNIIISAVHLNETSITTVFQSENVTEVLKSVIGENVTSKQTLTEDQIKNGYLNDDSVFNQVYEQYLEREPEEQLQKITISETSYNNIAESVTAIFDTTGVSEDIQKQFNEKISEMVGLMFTYPNQYE